MACKGICTKERCSYGTFYTKSLRNLWVRKGRKMCRQCGYGLVTHEINCRCCGRIFAYTPKNNKSRKNIANGCAYIEIK